jgi:hypothetical protein
MLIIRKLLLLTVVSGFAAVASAKTIEYEFIPGNFPASPTITNPYLPWNGGSLVFRAVTEDECVFTKQTLDFAGPVYSADYTIPATVGGVAVLVVRDQEWEMDAEDGVCDYGSAVLVEDTIDFYAEQNQENEPDDGSMGTEWYLGEDTFSQPDLEEGEGPECSTAGGWRAGVLGAEPGIIMLAHPTSGDRYAQEYDEDNAEDWAAVNQTNRIVSLEEFGGLTGCVNTKEWSPLEPGAVEKKTYCVDSGGFPGGLALVEELTGGKTLRVEYIGPSLPVALPGDGALFPAFGGLGLGCTDPNAAP